MNLLAPFVLLALLLYVGPRLSYSGKHDRRVILRWVDPPRWIRGVFGDVGPGLRIDDLLLQTAGLVGLAGAVAAGVGEVGGGSSLKAIGYGVGGIGMIGLMAAGALAYLAVDLVPKHRPPEADEPPLSAPRPFVEPTPDVATVRVLPHREDLLARIDEWALANGFAVTASSEDGRRYEMPLSNHAVDSRLIVVQITFKEGETILAAWLTSRRDSADPVPYRGLESGNVFGFVPARRARGLVNKLLAEMNALPIS